MAPEKELSIEELYGKFPAALEYLKEIFLINRDYGRVQNSVIAKRLGVSKPAVTQAMNRLRKYNLIEQDLYVELTTLRPKLMRIKNRKIRAMHALYPGIQIKMWRRKDFMYLLERFGLLDRQADLVGKAALDE